MAKKIVWNENGWTVLQDADKEKHILEMSCLCANGTVTEIRLHHNDGEEEEIYRGELKGGYSLPMPLEDFQKAFNKNLITLK